ncbi:MAG TPA: metallophosphoesterase [Terracidiphilus sp.]|nr:metallophosphoesterase [Terracidiphilus sp.]
MKAWPTLGVLIVESILLAGHLFVYRTWIAFHGSMPPGDSEWLRALVLALSFSFVVAALLNFRFSNPLVRVFYYLAALWLGFLNFFFWASSLAWLVWLVMRFSGLVPHPASIRPWIVISLFSLAVLVSIYGAINAQIIRLRQFRITLPSLPDQWRGRTAALLSDLHLGNINSAGFCRRVTALAARYKPDIVFLPGDLFDGGKADLDRLTQPLEQLAPPFGFFYSTGNHEEFTLPSQYIAAVTRRGVRNLDNECVNVDGLQVAGITWSESAYPIRMKSALDAMNIDRSRASILLNHSPSRLQLVERAGFNLQLSGHTHGGQFAPFTWITRRVFGKFTHGLHSFESLQVCTSTGAGTWGPPIRVGARPEIVLLRFE